MFFFAYEINTIRKIRNDINIYIRSRGESLLRYVIGVDIVDDPKLLKSSRLSNIAIRLQRCSRSSYSS